MVNFSVFALDLTSTKVLGLDGCRWHVARKSECTAQCGLGYRTLEIHCAKISRADGKTQKVDDRYCSGQHKPDNKEGCHGDCNPGGWDYSPWSEVGAAVSFVCLFFLLFA